MRRLDLAGGSVGWSKPVVVLLLYLPGFGFAAFEADIGARISGAAETDLVPCPGMSVVSLNGVTHHQLPEAMHRHALPDLGCGLGLAIVDSLQYQILLQVWERKKVSAI